MEPTRDEIAVAAYYRWERRGGEHGSDRDDWIAAEKDLKFARGYRWIARHKLRTEGDEQVFVGKPEGNRPRRCRYCELAEPAASFEETIPLIPEWAGNNSLVACDECDSCRADFADHLDEELQEFARPWLKPLPDLDALQARGITPAAHKALARLGIGLLPSRELHYFSDALEWVSNPDHDREASLLEVMGLRAYHVPSGVPSPFASLARRTDDSSELPYFLFFLGTGHVIFQLRVPLSTRDEDLDPSQFAGPELSMSMGLGSAHRASESRLLLVKQEPRPRRRDFQSMLGALS